jgi:hypothetical protein
MVVATGTMNSQIVLARGVSDTDFAVSIYAHGALPLQPITVLGQTAYLYPGVDLMGGDRNLVGRVPFAAGPNRASNACSRWELRASGAGLTTSSLAAYTSAIRSVGGSSTATNAGTSSSTTTTFPPNAAFGTTSTPCSSSNLSLEPGPAVPEVSENDSQSFILVNTGTGPCDLDGYPTLTFFASDGSQVAYSYSHAGDQELTSNAPQSVDITTGHAAFFAVNFFRADCSQTAAPVPVKVQMALPQGGLISTEVAQAPSIAPCGPTLPLDVSPIEPTFQAALSPEIRAPT